MSRIRAHALLAATALVALGTHTPATAAAYAPADLRATPAATISDSLSLSLLGQSLDSATLDWRTPRHRLQFDLPPSDWVEAMTLRLSADPLGGAGGGNGGDVLVQLNGGEPTRLKLSQRGFTAQLDLAPSDLRGGRNTLTLALADNERSCLTAADGGWDIDLYRSRLDTTLRAKGRSVFLSEVDALLKRPTPEPLRVRIRSLTPDADTSDALIAQGVALRASQVPDFMLSGNSDLEILTGTRAALAGLVRDSAIMDSAGGRIAVDTGRPLRLVVTGDTEAEVKRGLQAFATHGLPNSRHRITTPEGLTLNPRLGGTAVLAGRKTELAELGGLDFSDNWGAGPDEVVFDVADPTAASARVKLDIARAAFLSPDSTVSVELNGRSLATTRLDTDRVKLDMTVPQGWLQGRGNTLRVTPDLLPSPDLDAELADGCAPHVNAPGLRVAGNSSISLRTPAPSASTDLARLSAGGGVLTADRGADTHVVLPRVRGEREDALRILGQLATAGGASLTSATYGTTGESERNLLALGRAPAGLDFPRPLRLAANSSAAGGIIALAPEGGRFVGLIQPTRGGSLGLVADLLVDGAWNDMAGGITRIDRRGTDTVQTAWAAPDAPTPGLSLPELRIADWQIPRLTLPAVELDTFAEDLTLQAESTVETLRDSWTRIDIRMPALRAKDGLRGRYSAPRVVEVERVSPTLAHTLQADAHRLSAGLGIDKADWKRFQARSARKAARLRGKMGLSKPDAARWAWADRHMSFAALLVMLAFTLSCIGLMRSEWNGR